MKNNFQKVMVTGLASIVCAGSMSIATLPNYSNLNSVDAVYAATIKDTAMTATGTVNSNVFLRKGPGTSYGKITILTKGSKVDIVAKSSNGWYKIKYKNSYGYSYKDYITVKDSDVTTTETEYTATGTTTTSLNVRKSPSASATKLGTLGKNAKVDIVAKTSNGWYKIKYNKDFGYVSGSYVTIGSSTPTTPTTGETEYTATGTPKYNLKVRAAASTSSKQIGSVKKGAKVEIVAKTTNNAWYKIKYNNGYGYVAAQYVTVKSTTDTPTTPEVKYPATGVAVHAVFIRESANTKSKEVGVLYTNDTITVLGKATDGWYKVQYKDKDGNTDKVGYVYGDYLTIK